MGILGKIINKVGSSKIGQAVFKPGGIVDTITKPVQYVGAIVANPITTIKQSPKAALEEAKSKSFENQAGKVLLNTGVVGAAVLTGGTSVGRSAAVSLAKSLTPTTPKRIITAAVAAPIAIGVLKETKKPLEAVSKAPSELTQFGSDIGKFVENPSTTTAADIVQNSPLLTAGAGLLLAGGAVKTGAAVAGAISNIQTRDALKDLANQNNTLPAGDSAKDITQKEITTPQKAFIPETAITPATAKITSLQAKRSRRRSYQKMNQVNQRVNVVVQNKSSSVGIKSQNKNYLKRSILA